MKKVFVMRGLPGSGKSAYVKENFSNALVCSADDFFTDPDGVYRYDPAQIGTAHQCCFRKFLIAVQHDVPLIVVDNTNTSVAEIAPYVLAAESFGYTVEIVTIVCDPLVAAARNSHGVPAGTVLRMSETLRRAELPPWWSHRRICLPTRHSTAAARAA